MTNRLNLIAESGAPKKVLEAWRDDVHRCEAAWNAFGFEIGALRYFSAPDRAPRRFAFKPGKEPEGWCKPDHHGYTTPLKKSAEWNARLDALPQPESIHDICSMLGLPTVINYGDQADLSDPSAVSGSRLLEPRTSWVEGGPVVVHLDDFRGLVQELKDAYGDAYVNVSTIENDDEGTIPEGFTIVSDARLEYLNAKLRLEREEAQEAERAAAADNDLALG